METKHLQLKYNLLHICYWCCACTVCGYVAIYLQHKGLSNTMIGLVTGSSCVLMIPVSPLVSSLPQKYKNLTIQRLLDFLFILSFVVFLLLSYTKAPSGVLVVCYMGLLCISACIIPLLSALAMDYIHNGAMINFGISRGMGSISYAIAAIFLGQFLKHFSPDILSVIFTIASLGFLAISHSLPKQEGQTQAGRKAGSLFSVVRKYKALSLILIGYAFDFAGATMLATYLINIVKNLGGDTSIYGTAVFIMAVSEMPAMALTHKLMKKYDAMNLVIVAGVCYILRNTLICIAGNIAVLFFGMLFQSVTYGLLTAFLTYYVAEACDSEDEMMGQTLIGIMTSGIGSMIGNVLGGLLQDRFGIHAMLGAVILLTLFGSSILIFTGLSFRKGRR